MDKIVEKLRRRPLFFKVTVPLVGEQLKEDEPRLIRTLTLILEHKNRGAYWKEDAKSNHNGNHPSPSPILY